MGEGQGNRQVLMGELEKSLHVGHSVPQRFFQELDGRRWRPAGKATLGFPVWKGRVPLVFASVESAPVSSGFR